MSRTNYIIPPFMPSALHQKTTAIGEMLAKSGQALNISDLNFIMENTTT